MYGVYNLLFDMYGDIVERERGILINLKNLPNVEPNFSLVMGVHSGEFVDLSVHIYI